MKTSNKILLSLFGLLLVSTLAAQIIVSQKLAEIHVVNGSGKITSETRSIEPFDQIKLHGQYKVFLTQGTESLRLETDDNLLDLYETYVEDGVLRIRIKKGSKIVSSDNTKVYIGFETLKEINMRGSCEVKSETPIVVPRLEIASPGYCKANLSLETEFLGVSISGSGVFVGDGKASRSEYDISGDGSVYTLELDSDHVEIDISGNGNAEVKAIERLEVDISGNGGVAYRGQPTLTQSISGNGKIKSIE